jgi:peptidyl-prolyl cis-trans isomerase C
MKIAPALVPALAAAAFAMDAVAQTPKTKTPAKPAAAAEEKAPVAPAAAVKDPLAVVDGAEVKIADVERVLGTMLARQGGSIGDVPPEMKGQLYRQILEGVIVEKIVTAKAAKVEVADADVVKEFDRFKSQFPSEEEWNKQLAATGQTVEGIRAEIRQFLQQNRWLDEQLKGKLDVTDSEVESFYKENPDQFKTPEQVRASHILLSIEEGATEEAVKAKRDAIGKILDRAKKGEDFAKLATELSEDPSAKENHGDLDFFAREQMVPEFSNAAFAMKKGELSAEPVRSQFGFHIIKVTDRKESSTVALVEARPRLLEFLQDQKRNSEMGKLLRTLREGAKVTVNLPDADQ